MSEKLWHWFGVAYVVFMVVLFASSTYKAVTFEPPADGFYGKGRLKFKEQIYGGGFGQRGEIRIVLIKDSVTEDCWITQGRATEPPRPVAREVCR